MAEGKLIVFEGLDGSGLTTQAEELRKFLVREQIEVHLTKEPSDGPVGAMIKLALAKRLVYQRPNGAEALGDATLALMFAADRVDHLENDVNPQLAKGVNVICDRYYLSSLAYQSLSVDSDWIRDINRKCRRPDLTLFLNVPAEICKKRMERLRWHVEHRQLSPAPRPW